MAMIRGRILADLIDLQTIYMSVIY